MEFFTSVSELVRLEKGCCCLSLRTGNLVIGWLGAITWVPMTIYAFLVLVMGKEDILEDHDRKGLDSVSPTDLPEKQVHLYIKIALEITFVICLINAASAVAHLYGTYKYRAGCLKPALIIGLVHLGATFTSIIIGFVDSDVSKVFEMLFVFALTFYCLLVVWSFYKQIQGGHLPAEQTAAPMGMGMNMGMNMAMPTKPDEYAP